MFIIKKPLNKLYGGKYLIDEYSVVYNSVCAGGQLFFGEDRHLFIDLDMESGQCYGISIILDAFVFCEIDYKLEKFSTGKLFYNNSLLKNYQFCMSKDLLCQCHVNSTNGLIMIGDPNASAEPINFFDDTFAVIEDGKIKLLIVKVGEEIIQRIKNIK